MTDRVYDNLLYNWDRLQRVAKTLHPGLAGEVINIVACPFDAPIYQGNKILVRAHVASSVGDVPQPETAQKVVLVLRSSDWLAVDRQTSPLHVLAAPVSVQSQQYLLDCTGLSSVGVTCCNLVSDTTPVVGSLLATAHYHWRGLQY